MDILSWILGYKQGVANGDTPTAEAVEEYDGSVTVSGGTASLISFTISTPDGTVLGTYQADNGMTWSEWCESEYNTVGYEVWSSNGYVYTRFGTNVRLNGSMVSGTDEIIADGSYTRDDQTSG